MEGRGVTNYDTDKPAFAHSAKTTEFDDALIQRGIITLEEALERKGASSAEAQRLAALKQQKNDVYKEEDAPKNNKESQDDSDDSFSDDDDEFLQQYRAQRLQQLQEDANQKKKNQSQPYFGQVVPIARPEWTRHVNEDSQRTWVVVVLTSSDAERTGCCEAAAAVLANKFPYTKFVTIPSRHAIANWPDEHLPTLFLYRRGKMQKELIKLPRQLTADELEWKLAQEKVLQTTLEEEPVRKMNSGLGRSLMLEYDDDEL